MHENDSEGGEGQRVLRVEPALNGLTEAPGSVVRNSAQTDGSPVGSFGTQLTGVRLSVIASALFVPVAYVFGRSYEEAWIKAHDLPVQAFPISVEDALLGAYVGFLHVGSRMLSWLPSEDWLLPFVVAVLALSCLAYLWFGVSATIIGLAAGWWSTASKAIYGWLETSKFKFLREKILPAFGAGYLVASIPVVVIGVAAYILLLSVIPAVAGEKIGAMLGEEASQNMAKAIASGKFERTSQFVELTEGSDGRVACVVKCGDQGCGLMTSEGTEFVTWDAIKRISSKPPLHLGPPPSAFLKRQ